MDRLVEMVRLHRNGVLDRKAAQMLRMGPNQHRKAKEAFLAAGVWDGDVDALPEAAALRALLPQRVPKQQVSQAERWRTDILKLERRGGEPKVIHQRLQLADPAFDASYDSVKRLVRTARRARPPTEEDVTIPVETAPGLIAQVDFGYVGFVVDPATGEPRKAWVFLMILAFSRYFFARVVFDQTVTTWTALHVEAFEFFGAVPNTVVPDNLKAAVVRAAFGADSDVEAQRDYRELARYYNFLIDPAPKQNPKAKGKVERMVKYVTPFLSTREPGTDLRTLNADLDRWNLTIACKRTHQTTRIAPLARFENEERAAMLPLPAERWTATTWRCRQVQPDAHVPFDGRLYSVPWPLIGRTLWVRATPDRVTLFDDTVIVADHNRRGKGHRSTATGHLPQARASFAERSPEAWTARAGVLGPECEKWAAEVLATPIVSGLRVVQGAVLWLEELGAERAEAVCRRAREYGVRKLGGLKNIARLGLERRADVASPPPDVDPAVYARGVAEIYLAHQGVADVSH